jgi:hypothetical protein
MPVRLCVTARPMNSLSVGTSVAPTRLWGHESGVRGSPVPHPGAPHQDSRVGVVEGASRQQVRRVRDAYRPFAWPVRWVRLRLCGPDYGQVTSISKDLPTWCIWGEPMPLASPVIL